MTLEDLGYNEDLEKFRISNNLLNFDIGRIISEHKERYIVKTVENEFEAEITGNLRFSAKSRNDFPAVGDWVSVSQFDENKVIIYNILPRKNSIERLAVGKFGERQIIASNIDFAFIVQAIDRDFNINRLERYLTICFTSDVSPIIVINKIDLINENDLHVVKDKLFKRLENVPAIFMSNENGIGIDELKKHILKGKTYCLLGSSGVGKSTLLNNLAGKTLMNTNSISESTQRGKHITSYRQLFILENGGLLIDNPGMREVGITDSEKGLEVTFDDIINISANCKFADCKHINEAGCAVIEAVENGIIDKNSYENYLKMEKEKQHFEMNLIEKRKKDKQFGKMVKQFKKDIKKI